MTWICRGWPELDPPKDVSHQWMHAYYEVPDGEACSICHALVSDQDRWDGVSDPFLAVATPKPSPLCRRFRRSTVATPTT